MFDDIKTDYHSSRVIANNILQESKQGVRVSGAMVIRSGLGMISKKYENGVDVFNWDFEEQRKEFLRTSKIGKNEAELTRHTDFTYTSAFTEYGAVLDHGNVVELNDFDVRRCLERSKEVTERYHEEFQKIRFAAEQKLADLKELKEYKRSNSKEFDAMYEALSTLSKMVGNNTPTEVEQAIRDLRNASQDYIDKIDNQFFKKGNENGQSRYDTAGALVQFADTQTLRLTSLSKDTMALDEGIFDQMESAYENFERFKQKMAQKQAQKVNAPEQKVNAPEQKEKEPEQKEKAPEQEGPKPDKQEQRRKLDRNEVKSLLQGDAPKRERRMSVRVPQKHTELGKHSEPRKK